MKKIVLIFAGCFLLLLHFNSCNTNTSADNNSISSDTATIAKGEAIFKQNCSGCHNFKLDGIGPHLGGITSKVSANWIKKFINNPQQVISSGDEQAQQLIKKYKVAAMPSFSSLKDDELNAIVSFLNIQKIPDQIVSKEKGNEVSNPIPAAIPLSDLLVNLEEVTQIPASGKIMPITKITKLSFQPNTGSLFINDLRGKLYKLKNNRPEVYMDIANLRPKFINEPGMATGFGSFTFHPGFAKNGLLYTSHTEAPHSGKSDFVYNDSIEVALQWVLTEWQTKTPDADTFSGTGRELLRVNMVTGSHGMQEITFDPQTLPGDNDYGKLYIGIGDGGAVQMGYSFILHGNETIWGSILRIDPMGRNSINGQYGIPRDNPFASNQNTKALGEIYAYGFRNPHRITWGRLGEMIACNIGQANIESLNLIEPGHNYGWPIREGPFVFDPYSDLNKIYPLPANDSIYKITYPIAEYDHDEGKAISGGYEYWGIKIPQLKGKFLFGDIPTGRLFYIDMADVRQGKQTPIKEWRISINNIPRTLKEVCGSERVDLHFGKDIKGELYVLTKADGKVYKLTNSIIKNSKNQKQESKR